MGAKKTSAKRAPAEPSPGTPAHYAAFWRVGLRTAQKWLAEPGRAAAPPTPPRAALDDPAAMVAWVRTLPTASQSKLTPTYRARIDLFRLALERGEPLPVPSSVLSPPSSAPVAPGATHSLPSGTDDPDYTTFLAERTARQHALATGLAPADTTPTTLSLLKLRFDFADYKVGLAQRRGDHAAVREWTDTAARLAGVIHDEELRAQKLGREVGDILPRPEAERLLRALAYWLLRSTDDLLATLSRHLAAASAAPLYPAAVRTLLEPHLLAARVLTPLARAAQINAGTTLPDWALAALRESLASTLEDGEKLFNTLYASSVPRPDEPCEAHALRSPTGEVGSAKQGQPVPRPASAPENAPAAPPLETSVP